MNSKTFSHIDHGFVIAFSCFYEVINFIVILELIVLKNKEKTLLEHFCSRCDVRRHSGNEKVSQSGIGPLQLKSTCNWNVKTAIVTCVGENEMQT